MSIGPLRRFVGMLGLLALAPTAVMLGLGRITPATAALRAVATLLVAVIIGRVAGWWVAEMARGYEFDAGEAAGGRAEPGAPQRRRSDRSSAVAAARSSG
jgi:uncharacterized membrane protein YraQ (UPF0718 family)